MKRLKWTPLSRPFLAGNKLIFGGSDFEQGRPRIEAAPCHSGARIGAQVASLRSLIFRSSTSSVEPNILARKR
jgi:hypothetical protein